MADDIERLEGMSLTRGLTSLRGARARLEKRGCGTLEWLAQIESDRHDLLTRP